MQTSPTLQQKSGQEEQREDDEEQEEEVCKLQQASRRTPEVKTLFIVVDY